MTYEHDGKMYALHFSYKRSCTIPSRATKRKVRDISTLTIYEKSPLGRRLRETEPPYYIISVVRRQDEEFCREKARFYIMEKLRRSPVLTLEERGKILKAYFSRPRGKKGGVKNEEKEALASST